MRKNCGGSLHFRARLTKRDTGRVDPKLRGSVSTGQPRHATTLNDSSCKADDEGRDKCPASTVIGSSFLSRS